MFGNQIESFYASTEGMFPFFAYCFCSICIDSFGAYGI